MQSVGNPPARQVSSASSRPERKIYLATFINNLKTTKENASTFGNALIWVCSSDCDSNKKYLRFQKINSFKKLPDFSVCIDQNNMPIKFIEPSRNYNTFGPDGLIGIPKELKFSRE